MSVELDWPGIALWVCTIGLAIVLPILALGRIRFARQAAHDGAAPPNENVHPNPVIVRVQRYLLLSGAQLLLDLTVLGYFAYLIFADVAAETAREFVDSLPPIWLFLLAGLGRVVIEFPIRATRRRIVEILRRGFAQ